VVLVVVGLLLVLMAGTARSSVGASFLTLGILSLVTAGGGLRAERLLHRKPPPATEGTSRNGRDGRSLQPSRIERLRRP
jgi:hypothetical protein